MFEGRIKHLEAMHESLDNRIDTMERTGVFDDTQLTTLKKQRLQVRDDLRDLRQQQQEHDQKAGSK
jgi:uncharacterized protein YdcH (DUF465 family)